MRPPRRGVHLTDRLRILLPLAAHRHRTSPSVVYHALILGLLAAQSGARAPSSAATSPDAPARRSGSSAATGRNRPVPPRTR
ncbi:hypothetical protein [Streptomyces sp. G-G2]|uniref:hypothetical protein n=1 Tax=Streptomyces sp. G-G2 TaxID=3046201 RepID=UPI0024BA5606|nr:hypothetical protein [Streptomyces sp. G-G2]MDJ0385337.1 hypothetical protein [Streptomyces sp. G-G2]